MCANAHLTTLGRFKIIVVGGDSYVVLVLWAQNYYCSDFVKLYKTKNLDFCQKIHKKLFSKIYKSIPILASISKVLTFRYFYKLGCSPIIKIGV